MGKIGAEGDGKGHVVYLRRSIAAGPEACLLHGRSVDGQSLLTGDATLGFADRKLKIVRFFWYGSDTFRLQVGIQAPPGFGRCHGSHGGRKFEHPSAHGRLVTEIASRDKSATVKYRLTCVRHEALQSTASYSNRFDATPSDSPFCVPDHHHKMTLSIQWRRSPQDLIPTVAFDCVRF